jgi:integrase
MNEIFAMAFADGLIPLNPALLTVIPPCKASKPKPILTPEEIRRAEQSMDIRERLVFRLDTTEGLRPSEWSGLQVGDAEADRIHVRRRNYRFHVNDPKNEKSKREIPLTSQTAAVLKEYRKLLIDDKPTAWLFPSEKGDSPMDYRNLFRRYLKPALVRCGLGHVNYQAMRRTFSSQHEAAGSSVQTRADLMGHGVNVNANDYTQTPFDIKQKAMRKLEKRLVH